ncbi:MAG: BatA domain-containing protein [Candidatus Woesearchaeota archaeon]|nr:BatA domain-containing protein [Candidatus Woesearchaeota archaeon]
MAFIQIGYMLGLWALLFLVPFIILYLIRPKPKEMSIPSLMFFMRQSKMNRITSFFKTFIRDLIFLMQLLVLASLAFSIAQPYKMYSHDVSSENTVFVIDVSASSKSVENSKIIFDKIIEKAQSLIGRRNTVVLAKDAPLVALQDASSGETSDYLKKLKPLDTASKIGDAIILAGELMSGKKGRVIAISDFINTGGQDPNVAKKVLLSKGLSVDFINVRGKISGNVGFVDLNIKEDSTTAYIKNFNDEAKTIKLAVGSKETDITLNPKSTEAYSFETPSGTTKLEIKTKDDFSVDNTAYMSVPSNKKIRVLLITNNQSAFIKNALKASDAVDLSISEPPIIAKDSYDIYIVHNIDKAQILPGTFEDLQKKANDGASLIIHVQEESANIDYRGALPLIITGAAESAFINTEQTTKFTKNINFGRVNSYFSTRAHKGTVIATASNSSILSMEKRGSGNVFYYGILEKASDFKFSPDYPIFWLELVNYLVGRQDIKSLNYRTGNMLILDKAETIETPSKKIKQATLILEEQGLYKVGGKTIAVNLLNERESNIAPSESYGQKGEEFVLKPVKEQRKFQLEIPLLIASMLILMLELLYIKIRGEI